MGIPSSLGGHPQLGLRRLLCPASQVLPPFATVGALPAVDPQDPHVLGDGGGFGHSEAHFYAMGHITNIIGAIDVFRNRKSFHSMNVQMVCLADQYISHVNTKYPGSVHDAFMLRNSSIPYVMAELQMHREDEARVGHVAAVDPVDSEDEEAEDKDEDNRSAIIQQYFQ
ncbi:hypothetical protein NDU88_005491 [Pleurodeles waltl]|uniref:DDE Tnp4 domain-containing protein n=1 Tax=Pleurodeles waltl TaxID=8319 RepID=A0AAV7WX70_PLEWA|nr:hypothetical protein NDU88_005491 [Pleurodeles waltl]